MWHQLCWSCTWPLYDDKGQLTFWNSLNLLHGSLIFLFLLIVPDSLFFTFCIIHIISFHLPWIVHNCNLACFLWSMNLEYFSSVHWSILPEIVITYILFQSYFYILRNTYLSCLVIRFFQKDKFGFIISSALCNVLSLNFSISEFYFASLLVESLPLSQSSNILWHVDLLLGNDYETNN
jgi:hypothetical protein